MQRIANAGSRNDSMPPTKAPLAALEGLLEEMIAASR
jgi:hypothetical protein